MIGIGQLLTAESGNPAVRRHTWDWTRWITTKALLPVVEQPAPIARLTVVAPTTLSVMCRRGGLPLGDRGFQPTRTHVFRTLLLVGCRRPSCDGHWHLPIGTRTEGTLPPGQVRTVPSCSSATRRVL